ncbi:hypothetical protein HS99_0008985 [Kitasatospora aureofaciens]|uniref:Uncharacterized protein n=1 Tax=Kitasatospora aureofaciens TaxID=1894 RepID=A0A1E7N1R5_KITAU|nr:hypothetical protein B6264_26810 [Kitasatospora aureofaciens]OEV34622.1 hypothetical protein HS99_0008985 [Kitasatospora aureofaciens]
MGLLVMLMLWTVARRGAGAGRLVPVGEGMRGRRAAAASRGRRHPSEQVVKAAEADVGVRLDGCCRWAGQADSRGRAGAATSAGVTRESRRQLFGTRGPECRMSRSSPRLSPPASPDCGQFRP